MSQHTEWHLQFVTDSRDSLVSGNERLARTSDGRYEHTFALRGFDEAFYRGLASKAAAKGADDIRLSKRVVSTARADWQPVEAP